ncbi:MAG: ABC transporter permease [Betaproteobacteria bacterium]|nr:MAG: ABC transporter permease [Betaproteobacteria bacterium]
MGRSWHGGAMAAGVLVAAFAAWEIGVRAFRVKPIVLPPPSAVFAEFFSAPGWYLGHAWYTLLVTLAGFALAVVLGVALAVLIVESRLMEKSVYALIIGLNSVPKVAVAPLFVIWLGTDAEPKIAIAFLIAVFAIVIDAVLGLKSVPPDILDLARALRGGRLATLWRIRFPCALPSLFAGMKVAISLALVGAIVGEFVSSQRGLGYVILAAQGNFDTARVFAAILVLAVMGVALFWLIAWLERLAIPWHASQKVHLPTP